ncbi:MAG: terminase small subunit [Filifactor alocis]|nr:terminase small subunit [Filifactor alocis]
MARAPNKKKSTAKELYYKGERLVDIAKRLDVPEGTVRRWKHQWANETGERSEEVVNARKEKANAKKKLITEEVEAVIKNTELTDRQQLFCLYFIRSFNAARSYQKAYGGSYGVAGTEGYKLLKKPHVREEIDRLKKARYTREFLSESDIFQEYMDYAFSDIGDYIEFGTEEVPVMSAVGPVIVRDEETGEKKMLTRVVNVARFKQSTEVDTSLILEVKQGKEGASIKLPDKLKALDWLANHMNMATEEQKAKVQKLFAEVDKIQAETEKTKASRMIDDSEYHDDGFLSALKGEASNIWSDEDEEGTV